MNREEIEEEVDPSINSNNLESQLNSVQNESPPSIYNSNIVFFGSDAQNIELIKYSEEMTTTIIRLQSTLSLVNEKILNATTIELMFFNQLCELEKKATEFSNAVFATMVKTYGRQKEINASIETSDENAANATKKTMN